MNISTLNIRANEIRKLMNIQNVILANSAYHEKEMEKQIEQIKKTATTEELKLITQIWDKRHNMAKKLQNDVGEYLNAK